MVNEFDPYREALVIEQLTDWPESFDDWDSVKRLEAEARLHADPQAAEMLEYVRQHTGFARKITVTDDDLSRIGMS
ncbi:MAG: hypothetical protein SGJ20_01425 [Planctomycetota bacterium]|nr:hypothetical protein [Planctomycetota bacterium]